MTRFSFATFTFLFSIASVGYSAAKPNIVFILADDLGIGDVKCYGGDRCLIDTPNIDALAARGVRFTDAHANASICGPTRRAIMTGRYNWRFGPYINSGPWGFVGPRPGTEKSTLGKLLKRSGYQTGYVGKWHLGTIMATRDGKKQGLTNVDFTKPLRYGPVQFGFDESFILPGSLDMYPYAFARNNVWQGEVTAQKGWSAFNRVGPAEKDFEDHEVIETFYTEAESFIEKQTARKPFFLFLALTGEELAETEAPDSISFAPLLSNPSAKGNRTDLVMESTMHFTIRQGDWKFCLTPSCGMQAGFENGSGNVPSPEFAWRSALDQFGGRPTEADLLKAPFVQLYNLADDPTESRNVAADHPDRVKSMSNLLQHQVDNGRSTPGPKLNNDKPVRIVNLNDRRLPEFVRTGLK